MSRSILGWRLAPVLAALFAASPTVAAPGLSRLGLDRQEGRALDFYSQRILGFDRTFTLLERADQEILIREAQATGDLEQAMTGLRQDFRSAAINCTLAALKNARKVSEIVKKLKPGPLRTKIERVLKKPKAQKLLRATEKTGEAIESGLEQVEEAQEQQEQIEAFLEVNEKEGLVAAVRVELANAVQSELENIFPLDLDQPPNEVVVDGFIELSKAFPATAPFSGIFETTASVTKKLVRVYAQSLALDAAQGNRDDNNVIRKRIEFDKQRFLEDSRFRQLPKILDLRLQLINGVSMGSEEALRQVDRRGLRSFVGQFVRLPFQVALRRQLHDPEPLEKKIRDLAKRLIQIDKALLAFETARRKAQEEELERRRREFEQSIRESEDRPTGKEFFGEGGGLRVFSPRQESYRSSRRFRYRRPRHLELGLDQLSRDLRSAAEELVVVASQHKFVQVMRTTKIFGRPDCGRFRGASYRRSDEIDRISEVKTTGGISISNNRIQAAGPARGTVSLGGKTRSGRARSNQSVSFQFTERVSDDRTVTRNESRSCSYSDPAIVDAPAAEFSVAAIGFQEVRYSGRFEAFGEDRPLAGALDYLPELKAEVVLTDGEQEYVSRLERVEAGSSQVGFVVEELTPAPKKGIGEQYFRAYVQDSKGEQFGGTEFSVNHFVVKKLQLDGTLRMEPSDRTEALLFGAGLLTYSVEGPIQDQNWRLEWVQTGDAGAISGLPASLTVGTASVELPDRANDDFRIARLQPFLIHKPTGQHAINLIQQSRYDQATLRFFPPRIRRMFVQRRGSKSERNPKGIHLFSVRDTPHGKNLGRRGAAVRLDAIFEDESGTQFGGEAPLPDHLKIERPPFRLGEVQGLKVAFVNRKSVFVRASDEPGRGSLEIVAPEFRTSRGRDHRHLLHPEFEVEAGEVGMLHSRIALIRTVDFATKSPALEMRIEGDSVYGAFEVEWPSAGEKPVRTEFTPVARGALSRIPLKKVFRLREATVLGGAGLPVAKILVQHFSSKEARTEVPSPGIDQLVEPPRFEQGRPTPMIAFLKNIDTFGAASTLCRWSVTGAEARLLDGRETLPKFDSVVQKFRCQNRLEFVVDSAAIGRKPKVTVDLLQKGP